MDFFSRFIDVFKVKTVKRTFHHPDLYVRRCAQWELRCGINNCSTCDIDFIRSMEE